MSSLTKGKKQAEGQKKSSHIQFYGIIIALVICKISRTQGVSHPLYLFVVYLIMLLQ
jgi:hypothetical protein